MKKLIATFLLVAITQCNGDQERPEVVNKLRAIGVASTPLASAPSTSASQNTASLTFHLVLPLAKTIDSVENYVDTKSPYAAQIPLTINTASASYSDYSNLRHYTITADAAIPEVIFLPGELFRSFRYALKVTADKEEEIIVGNLVVYPSDSEELDWKGAAITISSPVANSAISGETQLKAKINKSIDENLRVSWFASNGEIKNRRAAETTWDEYSAGTQTLILTVRGRKSGDFQLQIIDLTTQ